jgi:hypothetical protein
MLTIQPQIAVCHINLQKRFRKENVNSMVANIMQDYAMLNMICYGYKNDNSRQMRM